MGPRRSAPGTGRRVDAVDRALTRAGCRRRRPVAAPGTCRVGAMTRRERLASALAATDYQRAWFQQLATRARAGEPFALVNADAPHEVLRAFGVEYAVNQWWA